ncbi:MAG: peptidoglycan-binding protein [Clostridia bacterium]|nr:peptidoglycan-binding protein [Clostridia bacterium]
MAIRYPTIPEYITVHLGPPDSNARNVTLSFPDYIKNVASGEIYPTWPESALRANIYAQISYALNRVYLEYYRSRGYDFDITSTTALDQSFEEGRNIFENISLIVDEIFNSYIKREENLEPLAAKFCNGTTTTCEGLSQWGSVDLANQGLGAYDILTNYYGDDIVLVEDVAIDGISESYPGTPLRRGDSGFNVIVIQRSLNGISNNYPAIPKINPVNGVFDENTENAVRKFQEIFKLTVDGIVGRVTWYRLVELFVGIKRLSELESEGVRLSEFPTVNGTVQTSAKIAKTIEQTTQNTLRIGSTGRQVWNLQFILQFLSYFYPTALPTNLTGVYTEATANSVRAMQKEFNLPQTGEADDKTLEALYNAYITIADYLTLREPFENQYWLKPFSGRVLLRGETSEDVREIQRHINYISRYGGSGVKEVSQTGVFGPLTAQSVSRIQDIAGLSQSGAVESATHSAIRSQSFDAISTVNSKPRQYPGFTLSRGDSDSDLRQNNKTISTPVMHAQQKLRRISNDKEIPVIIPNGIFGDDTEQAVIIIQNDGGLEPNGVIDYDTWEYIVLLDIESEENRQGFGGVTPNSDNINAFAEIMQQELQKVFVNIKDAEVQEEQIKEIQKILKLPQTGEIDRKTWEGIVNLYESINSQ